MPTFYGSTARKATEDHVIKTPLGVLVAISIPIFTTQLEKAREATDASNIRAAYAELVADYLTESNGTSSYSKTISVPVQQKQTGWAQTFQWPSALNSGNVSAYTSGTYKVHIDNNGKVTVSN